MLQVLVALLALAGCCEAFNIAAFNIEIFGVTKFSKPEVVAHLSQIVQRYDIVLIQELRDSSATVIHSFLEVVNEVRSTGIQYEIEVSERLGRSVSKEQYVFMYRKDLLEVVSTYQYDDSVEDVFQREPFSVQFRNKNRSTVIPDFFLMGIHTQPSNAAAELDGLVDAYNLASAFFGTENGFILGDFNADCGSLSQTRYESLLLVTDERFTWLINNTADTTVAASSCAYDRIVAAGAMLQYVVPGSPVVFRFDLEYSLTIDEYVVPGSPAVFRFDLEYSLTIIDETDAVSDHFPVECCLLGSGSERNTAVVAFVVLAVVCMLLSV